MIIEIEGIDGTGKSFLSKELSKEFGFGYYKTPSRLKDVRENFDFSPDARYTFYLLGCSEVPEGNWVLDRYVLSTVAYHSVANPEHKDTYLRVAKKMLTAGILQRPDVVVYLCVDEHKRKERIMQRPEGYYFWDLNSLFLEKVHHQFEELISRDFLDLGNEKYLRVDTSQLQKEEVVRYVKRRLIEIVEVV